MVEPTESESMHELDRFIDAMIQIRDEIRAVEEGKLDREDNPLLNAPHTPAQVSASEWTRSYPRQLAAFPSSEERRVGQQGVSTCSFGWSPYHERDKENQIPT